MADFQIAKGTIEDVFAEASGLFCEVRLRHYTQPQGDGMLATCRLAVPYHGETYGDWWTPEIGTEVLVAFPGIAADGSPGGDLADGYIFAYTSTKRQPPQLTTDTLRIVKGKPGEDRVETVQASHTMIVDVDEMKSVGNDQVITVKGEGSWVGQMSRRIEAAINLILKGTMRVELTSDTIVSIQAPVVEIGGPADTVIINGKVFLAHTHGGVTTGGSNTSGVS